MLLKIKRTQKTALGSLMMGVTYDFDMKVPAQKKVADDLQERKMAAKISKSQLEAENAEAVKLAVADDEPLTESSADPAVTSKKAQALLDAASDEKGKAEAIASEAASDKEAAQVLADQAAADKDAAQALADQAAADKDAAQALADQAAADKEAAQSLADKAAADKGDGK